MTILGHSYGCNVAYEIARLLQTKHSISIQHFIAVAGISISYLQTLPMYDCSFDDNTKLMQMMQETAVTMFDKVPDYLQLTANVMQQESALQGE